MRNRGVHRAQGRGAGAARGVAQPGVPRLRLGRPGRHPPEPAPGHQDGRPGPGPQGPGQRPYPGHDRHRPHPVGHPRRAERGERPSAHRRRGPHRPRAQRHYRERRAAQGRALGPGCQAGQRHRHRGARPYDRRRGHRRVSLEDAVRRTLRHVEGTYGLVVLDTKNPTSWSWRATAAPSCSASGNRRCSSPPTWRRWCATPSRSCTWMTPRWPRCAPPTISPRRSTRSGPARS